MRKRLKVIAERAAIAVVYSIGIYLVVTMITG